MPHHADPATPGPRVTGPAGLSTEFSWGGRMPSPRGWTPMSAHFEAAPSQNSQTRVLPMSQDRGLSVFNQSMPMTEPRFWCRLPALRGTSRSPRCRSPVRGAHRVSVHESPGRALPPSCIKISRAPLQCPDPFRHPAQQTKLWSVPHACCPRAIHPCIQFPRASRPRAAPCDPSTLVSTCSAARSHVRSVHVAGSIA